MINDLSIAIDVKPCFLSSFPLVAGAGSKSRVSGRHPAFEKSNENCQNVNTGCQNINTDTKLKRRKKSSVNRFEAGVTQPVESLPSNLGGKLAENQPQNGEKAAGGNPAFSVNGY